MVTIFSVPVHDPAAIPAWHSSSISRGAELQQPPPPQPSDRPTTESSTTVMTTTRQNTQTRLSDRIDLLSCPKHRLRIAPKVNFMVGMGHKMTEVFHTFWYAMTRGHCFCFDTEHFGNDMELYHLLLEPVFPSCQAEFPKHQWKETTLKSLEQQNLTELVDQQHGASIQWIVPEMGDIWPKDEQKRRPLGHGDILAFVDSFLRDNRLVEEVMYPWYLKHKSIRHVFQKNTTTTVTTLNNSTTHDKDGANKVVNAAFHIRVGDLVLEASESYWRNVFIATRQIVDLEHGPGHDIHIYWVYFQAAFNNAGNYMRQQLSKNAEGEWPSQPSMLPRSHNFLIQLCAEFAGISCFWKTGTNILETIDLFVESDVVYISGSSFSQVLALFNQGIRIQALPKEINYFGDAKKGSVHFLQTSTGSFSSLRHYYVDGTGELFDEHYAHLRLKPPNCST